MTRISWYLLAIIIAGVIFAVGKRIYYTHSGRPVDTTQLAYFDMWNQSRESVLEPLPIDTGDIVFVGNSITEGFPLNEMFHSLKIKNRGISGNRSCHIRNRIGSIAAARPAKLFLDIGINDILNRVALDTLKTNYQVIVNTICNTSPETKIYVQSVFPLGRSHAQLQRDIEDFNHWLMDYCSFSHIVYIDLFSSLYKDGFLNPDYTYDDIHLNGAGYEAWRNKITPLL
jgi:lysophospholipase L1-like esterase